MELQQVYKLNDVLKNKDSSDFVTVVSVGPIENSMDSNELSSEYVTVLKIGEVQNESVDDAEEVSVYRLPGERLGFGLKFEGGTKASEYVKRLFIQSCAPDSPASRVRSSWGCLQEGDEVIEIDSVPVQTMTRIDCVRCLKDSNVVIKLLVKRSNVNDVSEDTSDHLPLVISAEKKRTPPPPPPVPPRKISRKTVNVAKKTITCISHENEEPATVSVQRKTQPDSISTNNKKPVFQSTESIQRDQRILTENITGPPDAEIYIDLLSQESTYYMSESDDTGSSISTIVDRFSSFPTTTCSSVCSSLPTTPTSIQKQIDPTNIHNICEDDENSTEINEQLNFAPNDIELSGQSEFLYASLEKLTTTPLQPPTNFQDAPLSYGDEEIKLIITPILEGGEKTIVEKSVAQPPPPPPRSKQLLIKNNTKQEKLPRLVDYLPKFLHSESDLPLKPENEKNEPEIQHKYCNPKENLTACIGMWDEDKSHPFQSFLKNSQLATIGEDEEFTQDKNNTRFNTSSPAVVINDEKCSKTQCSDSPSDVLDENIMEVPPINFRQPPDGHELLNFKELPIQSKQKNNVQSIIAKFSTSVDYNVTGENANTTNNTSNVLERNIQISKEEVLSDSSLSSNCEVSQNAASQFSIEDQRWHTVGEQQSKRLSKLKGLIIPEQSVIEDIAIVDLPEIKTITTKMIPLIETKHIHDDYQMANNSKNSLTPSLTTPIWNTDNFNTIPKYSPAFKRKHLQIFGKSNSDKTISPSIKQYTPSSVSLIETNFLKSPSKLTAKSLESVIVPEPDEKTRTDQSIPKDEKYNNSLQSSYVSPLNNDSLNNDSPHTSELHALREEERKSKHPYYNSEYDRCESLTLNPRLLKPQSVEAINRKNILASAKCRSGQDLKIGSPLINRKSMDVVCASKKNESQDVSTPPNNLPKLQSDIKVKEFSNNYNTAEKKKRDDKSKEVITTTGVSKNRSHLAKNTNPTRVVDILKNFEKNVSPINTLKTNKINSTVQNSPKSVNIKESSSRTEQKSKINQNTNNEKNTSTKSNNKDATQTIVLCPEVTGGSVGITLAGGTDYETKEITIHKVRCGSPAHRDGRLKKGDKILSINGKSMDGLTHGESISILKASGTTVTLVIGAVDENATPITSVNEAKAKPKISQKQIEKVMVINENQNEVTIHLMKDSSGLGFSIEGGRDSSQGDLPLVVKKLFMGGAADRSKMLLVGDELININGSDVQGMPRIDVWSLMKKLPDGEVVIKIRR